ncbi:formylglycine-generating enzyme family protein [Nocardia sp. NBC_01329]|uniref:formylglycine-generating enzyme family protein n=1 Tax=Nocardia sp. NBC_01329 TaxID=2903594 RepID=UPI002E0D9F51|nr:formylglycine-generating enzyme family protein [Nocardia sp. NBC_01329]
MVRIPGGEFAMGSDDFFPEERPVHRVRIDSFRIDPHPVTNAAFRRFVKQTGYVTVAERTPAVEDYPDADPVELAPGALVFRPTAGPVALDNWRLWWRYVPGANWRHPRGPGSTLDGLDRHPVTQVAYDDAAAYAAWAGKQLPTEAEWEYAARGGLDSATFVWGDEFEPTGRRMANIWVGAFPWQFHPGRGQARVPGTTAVGIYAPNGYGLSDTTGNVWEWTADYFHSHHPAPTCCAPLNPRVDTSESASAQHFPHHVVKGGSYLCAANYCLRYRPAARQPQTEDTATCHLGFRCVLRDTEP